jgi:hypothetical protein
MNHILYPSETKYFIKKAKRGNFYKGRAHVHTILWKKRGKECIAIIITWIPIPPPRD